MQHAQIIRDDCGVAARHQREVECVDGFSQNSRVANCFLAIKVLLAHHQALEVADDHENRSLVLPVKFHRVLVKLNWQLLCGKDGERKLSENL